MKMSDQCLHRATAATPDPRTAQRAVPALWRRARSWRTLSPAQEILEVRTNATEGRSNEKGAGSEIVLERLTKSFAGRLVLRDIDLRLGSGAFFALLGPSGSGKSTLLNLIAGFEYPDGGDIRIRGRSVIGIPAHTRRVGVVFQNYALFPHLNVTDNLAYPLRRRGIRGKRIASRVDQMLALMRLGDYAQASIHQLSGGQQQRVAIARALIAEPDVLLMDEPMAALDKALRDDLQVELKTLQRAVGTTVIYITHDQREALALADHIGVLNAGRFEQVGAPRVIYSQPSSSFVARFLTGATVIPGTATRDGGAWHLDPGDGSRLQGAWYGPAPVGDGIPAEIALNPMKVRLVPPGQSAPSLAVPAIVTATLYGGDSTIVHLQVAGRHGLTAREPGATNRQPGEAVLAAWAPEDATLFPRAPGGEEP